MSSVFRFKQFQVEQDGAAMKVGTDGVLLGAWAPLPETPDRLLDVGSGNGLLALMLAQRCPSGDIEAVEIDPGAYVQCVENFEASPWADRLFCYHCSWMEFAAETEDRYQAIVSNPPFHQEQVKSNEPGRDLARREEALPFAGLVEGVDRLLAPEGLFSLILPYSSEAEFIRLAGGQDLYPMRILRVRGRAGVPVKRSLICFGRRQVPVLQEELIIERGRHEYTEAYKNLTRNFYLKM